MRVATPWKHPETGIYHYRKGVPEALRALLGKREEKVSLGTRDPRLARVLHAAKAAEVEARWAGLRADAAPKPIVKLTDKQEWALAGEIYRRHFAAHEDKPRTGRELGREAAHAPLAQERAGARGSYCTTFKKVAGSC
jgi:hypothetical protein